MSSTTKGSPEVTHTLTRRDLLIIVTERGDVESASNLDITCKVVGGSSILWIIEDYDAMRENQHAIRRSVAEMQAIASVVLNDAARGSSGGAETHRPSRPRRSSPRHTACLNERPLWVSLG